MSYIIDMTGKKVGHLTVLARDPNNHYRSEAFWICECDCPNHTRISVCGSALRNGHTKSCGCYREEHNHRIVSHKICYKNGISKKYPYLFKHYKRLIKYHKNEICDEWLNYNGVYKFIDDMKDTHHKGYYLHRKNPEKKYSKENCYWDSRRYTDIFIKKEL